MFEKIFVEKDLFLHPRIQNIISHFPASEIITIDQYDEYWGRFKKPYLQKRDNLNLYLAQKKGQLVKKTPDAYGINQGEHYYFIHAYNCIYECQYCYLQGYFNTPDIVLFINHEQIIEEMKACLLNKQSEVWFHAGEYSDSLAMSHITEELPIYFNFFKNNPNAFLELRTKSANVKVLEAINPLTNVITSFSLSPEKVAKKIDLKTPSLKARISAMVKLKDLGHPYAFHFDPIIYQADYLEQYKELIKTLRLHGLDNPRYISLGVARFTAEVYREVQRNYPDSLLHTISYINSFDNKVRPTRPLREKVLSDIKNELIATGFKQEGIYFCMEEQNA